MKLFLIACILLIFPVCLPAQTDSMMPVDTGSIFLPEPPGNIYRMLIDSNRFLNAAGPPAALKVIVRKNAEEPVFFYVMVVLLIILALFKTVYSRYFSTLFRVFFNTSLRQNQLTDQLEQARLPSLIFNIFFVITGGIYIYMLLHYFVPGESGRDWKTAGACIAGVGVCYLIKFISLKFAGWVTGYGPEADIYIFIVFLLNKVIGILLLPFIMLMLFSDRGIASYAVSISIIMAGLIVLLRFFRSYSLLQHRLKVSRFHFLLYIFAFEILPIAVIYRFAVVFLGINP